MESVSLPLSDSDKVCVHFTLPRLYLWDCTRYVVVVVVAVINGEGRCGFKDELVVMVVVFWWFGQWLVKKKHGDMEKNIF